MKNTPEIAAKILKWQQLNQEGENIESLSLEIMKSLYELGYLDVIATKEKDKFMDQQKE